MFNVKEDKSFWETRYIEGTGKVLLVPEYYYDEIGEYIEELRLRKDKNKEIPINILKLWKKRD